MIESEHVVCVGVMCHIVIFGYVLAVACSGLRHHGRRGPGGGHAGRFDGQLSHGRWCSNLAAYVDGFSGGKRKRSMACPTGENSNKL